MVKARNRESLEGVKERHNALAIYLKSLNQGGKATNYEKFFGKKYLAYLRGKEIVEKIKGQMAIYGRDKLFVIKPSERAREKARLMQSA